MSFEIGLFRKYFVLVEHPAIILKVDAKTDAPLSFWCYKNETWMAIRFFKADLPRRITAEDANFKEIDPLSLCGLTVCTDKTKNPALGVGEMLQSLMGRSEQEIMEFLTTDFSAAKSSKEVFGGVKEEADVAFRKKVLLILNRLADDFVELKTAARDIRNTHYRENFSWATECQCDTCLAKCSAMGKKRTRKRGCKNE